MSSRDRTSRVVLASALAATALFVFAGVLVWGMVPGFALSADLERDARPYEPPENIPVALEEARLPGVTVGIVEAGPEAIMVAPDYYAAELGRWRGWLADAGARLVDPYEVDPEVLLLPMAECMDNRDRDLLRRQIERGGGVITSGITGARDGNCAAMADTVLNGLLGERRGASPRYIRSDEGSGYILLPGETALSAGIPAGARLDLEPQSHVVFNGPEREIYYATFDREPRATDDEPFFDGAVARSLIGDGRVIAFGFGFSELTGEWSQSLGRLLMRNAVRWAAGEPIVQLAVWPAGYRAAAVVAQDVEADYANAAGAIEIIEEEGIPTTYFVVGNLAETHPFITRDMDRTGELASHSFSHVPMDTFSPEAHTAELRQSMATTQNFTEFSVRGFRPPEERFTVETLRGWAEVGGDYFSASDRGRAAGPVMVPLGEDSLVFFGRVTVDDYSLLGRHEIRDRSAMVESLVADMEKAIAYRGAYMFSYHSHLFAQDQLLPVLSAVIEGLRERPEIWLATAGDLATWWRTRAGIEIDVDAEGRSAELTNLSRTRFSDGSLLVDLPNGERRSLPVPELAPGESVRLRLDSGSGPPLTD